MIFLFLFLGSIISFFWFFHWVISKFCCMKPIPPKKRKIYKPKPSNKIDAAVATIPAPTEALNRITIFQTPEATSMDPYSINVVDNQMFKYGDMLKQKKQAELKWDYSAVSLISETDSEKQKTFLY